MPGFIRLPPETGPGFPGCRRVRQRLVALVALLRGDDVAAGIRRRLPGRQDKVVDDIDGCLQRHTGKPATSTPFGVLLPVPGALPDNWMVSRCELGS
jgi:hypothetical protein